jgi:3-hydroxy-9,10-secoandrosta-1,3,5(10)-triene-9,17-dione monooxygenase reductase component
MASIPGNITDSEFRAAMASFAATVTIITTTDGDGKPAGLTATAFSSVSKAPPLCLVCVAKNADAYPALTASGRFAVNFLAHDQEFVSGQFAVHGIDKFEGIAWEPGPASGCPVIAGAIGLVECTTYAVHPAGDHDVFIGAIERVVVSPGEPLLYYRGRYRVLGPG